MAASIARMQSAVEKQKLSVQRQADPAGDSGFFRTSWTTSPAAPASAPPVAADCDALPDAELSRIIASAAQSAGINPLLLRAMIRRESAARPCAVSDKGAQGLMQLMPATQADLGVQDPFNPEENLKGGARYIGEMLARYKGDLRLALAAYNAGPQRVDAVRDVPPIAETQAYVAAILSELGHSQERPE